MEINTQWEDYEISYDTKEPESSQQDLSIQHKAFQICKHQIEVSNSNILTDSLEKSQMKNNINEEEFYDCKEFIDDDLSYTQSFQWTRIVPKEKVLYTTKKDDPEWNEVYRRITINTTNNEIVEDLPVDIKTDDKLLHRSLPSNVNQTKTILFYYDTKKEILNEIKEYHNIN